MTATTDGKVEALTQIKHDVNGKVSGLIMGNDGETSTFDVIADKFRISSKAGDQAVFQVDSATGKTIIKTALIEGLTASNISAGAIQGHHISSATSISAGSGNNIAIMSGEDPLWRFSAGNAMAEDSPFRVDKTGKLYADNADITGHINATSGRFTGHIEATSGTFEGTITGSMITGSVIEGALIIGDSDMTLPTDADKGTGTRYLGYATGIHINKSRTVNHNDTSYMNLTLTTGNYGAVSANWTGEGTQSYNGETVYKNFKRWHKTNLHPAINASVSGGWANRSATTATFTVRIDRQNKDGTWTNIVTDNIASPTMTWRNSKDEYVTRPTVNRTVNGRTYHVAMEQRNWGSSWDNGKSSGVSYLGSMKMTVRLTGGTVPFSQGKLLRMRINSNDSFWKGGTVTVFKISQSYVDRIEDYL
ncbi:phage tail tip fiber protein [Vibrio sp. ER1A]|uniref:phage tail tip fiber protein n=1 Tax=Vibrio sp. ER1A TaxID=1517681 RepID=UPI0004DD8995|nr:hypothetical protein [Vibrio sp. ER1A]KFA97559.1 hypothetical protein HW45_09125 [Vibrio sp. ER1A]